jgi:alkylation response protein AidB-like acyl-CoA dehydrogenase
MTSVMTTPTGLSVLEQVTELAPSIADRAAEIEAARRIPPDLLDELAAAGCFRLLRPVSHGGIGTDLPAAMRVFETLARADASVGWTVMIGAGAWFDLVGLPLPSFEELFAGRPDAVVAGAFNPTGSIVACDGGYRVTGRWAFASGCEHADWVFGNCVEAIVDGVPHLRCAVLAPSQVVIEDTWTVVGLAGTGSHHFHVDDVFVAAERTFVPLIGPPCLDIPLVHVPTPSLISLVIASTALGVAQAALDDVAALATAKVPMLSHSVLAENPLFQFELATADTELCAARALIYESAEMAWAAAVERSPFTLEQRARMRAAAVWATERAVSVVTTAFRSAGGSAVYAEGPLQRRLRDINALAQHFLVKGDTLTTAGGILAGQGLHTPVF